MIWQALLCFARTIDRLMGWAPRSDSWGRLDSTQRAQLRIDGERAEDVWARQQQRVDLDVQLSADEATRLAEADAAFAYTPPEAGTIDRSGLSIDPW